MIARRGLRVVLAGVALLALVGGGFVTFDQGGVELRRLALNFNSAVVGVLFLAASVVVLSIVALRRNAGAWLLVPASLAAAAWALILRSSIVADGQAVNDYVKVHGNAVGLSNQVSNAVTEPLLHVDTGLMSIAWALAAALLIGVAVSSIAQLWSQRQPAAPRGSAAASLKRSTHR
jgi:hypothetical protein